MLTPCLPQIWLPTKINAVGINRTGDFDVIENTIELPIPANAPGNILVKARREFDHSDMLTSADSLVFVQCYL